MEQQAEPISRTAAFVNQDWSKVWPPGWKALHPMMQRTITDHGDSARWLQTLATLIAVYPQTACGRRPVIADLDLSLQPDTASEHPVTAPVGVHGALEPGRRERLEQTLRQLHPWRKGPWWLHDIHLDTEWRSDWKWRRLLPHLPDLSGQRILDVGSGNGYYGWQMLNAGAREVTGIDPTVLFVFQHFAMAQLLAKLYPDANNCVLPLRLEDLPAAHSSSADRQPFDTVFSMGVLYHRRDPLTHLQQLRDQLRPGGTLVLETLVCESHDLYPNGRYARMRNVHLVPRPQTISNWLAEIGFERCEVRDVSRTLPSEQRSTSWMTFESLSDALLDSQAERTVEGHPAPVRACFVANWPA